MVAVGLPLGIISALRQYSTLDFGLTTVSLIMAAIPQFVLALLCALFFGVILRWFPVTGLDNWKAWVLPVFCSAGMGIAIFTRMSRTTMLEVIRQDYIRTARAKGLNESVVVTRHALKNCLITLTTTLGAQVARMFSGSIIVETIFAIPGIGTYMMNGITSRDYPIVTGSIFVISLLVCTVNLTVDIVYAFIDPRIKAQFVGAAMKMKYVKALREREAS
jgi:peptide/nickel transport system permease protein